MKYGFSLWKKKYLYKYDQLDLQRSPKERPLKAFTFWPWLWWKPPDVLSFFLCAFTFCSYKETDRTCIDLDIGAKKALLMIELHKAYGTELLFKQTYLHCHNILYNYVYFGLWGVWMNVMRTRQVWDIPTSFRTIFQSKVLEKAIVKIWECNI